MELIPKLFGLLGWTGYEVIKNKGLRRAGPCIGTYYPYGPAQQTIINPFVLFFLLPQPHHTISLYLSSKHTPSLSLSSSDSTQTRLTFDRVIWFRISNMDLVLIRYWNAIIFCNMLFFPFLSYFERRQLMSRAWYPVADSRNYWFCLVQISKWKIVC